MAQLECLTLARGDLRFSARAIGRGPIALFLHGFPDTERTFDAQLQALAAAGFRAVAVRMRGYEPSSQPADQDYRGIRMAEDVLCWIDQLGGGPVHLIGHDWGAIIAQIVAAQAPGKVSSLTVMAVPRLKPFGKLVRDDRRQAWRSLYGAFFQIPRLPEWRINRANFAYLERLWRRWSPGWAIPPETLHEVRQAFAAPGVTEVGERPRRVFARGAAAEIVMGNQYPGIPVCWLVEDEVGTLGAVAVEAEVGEQVLSQAAAPKRLQKTGGQYLVGIDVGERKRSHDRLELEELAHQTGSFASVRASVMRPLIAAAAAMAGDIRCVRPPAPWRPSKLRLEVEAQRSPGAR